MEFRDPDKTLLALLLTLRNLETPLREREKEQLCEIGELLQLIPEDWDLIQQDLMDILTENLALYQQFKLFLTKLENVRDNLTIEFLPTEAELEQELPKQKTIERRGFPPGQSPQSFTEALMNDTIVPVLFDENPPEVTKKLSFLQRLQQALQNNNEDDLSPPMGV